MSKVIISYLLQSMVRIKCQLNQQNIEKAIDLLIAVSLCVNQAFMNLTILVTKLKYCNFAS